MWYIRSMAHERFTAHVGDRGRFVLPADVRRRLHLEHGDLLVIDVDDEHDGFVVRKASDVAHGFLGVFRASAPERDLAAELLEDRRAEAKHETEVAVQS
jgi:AbrB family looped-hinge helix DNA binding protein